MKSKNLLLGGIIVLLCSTNLFGGPVEVSTAKLVATNWYRHYAPQAKQSGVITKTIPYTYNNRDCFYIFSFDKGGFVLVSANDAVSPILGYGFDFSVPDSITNESVKSWFDGYARQIDTAFVLNLSGDDLGQKWEDISENRFPRSGEISVGPFLSTIWGQGWPYNAMCPSNSYGNALVGCTATAYAQVLKYWGYPKYGNGVYAYSHPVYGTIAANFGASSYNWDSMPDNTTAYNEEVARINYHCGVSINMDYGPFSSGAFTSGIPEASISYFGYNSDIDEVLYLNDQVLWETTIRNQLNLRQPVIYSGYNESQSVGHTYVIDGYNSEYFHINFGWNGSSNGNYLLTPNASGTVYQYSPSAIINLRPDKRIYTFKAEGIDSTSAKFIASVNPMGDCFTSAKFYFWLDEQIPAIVIDASPQNVSGSNPQLVSAETQNLLPNSTYSFCLRLENNSLSYYGDTLKFQTLSGNNCNFYPTNIYFDSVYVCTGNTWKGRTSGNYSDTTYFNNSSIVSYIINTHVIENSTIPIVTVNSTSSVACKGNLILLRAYGADNYAWDHGLQPKDSVWITATANTTYTVTGTFRGCTNNASISIVVNPTYLTERNITVGLGETYNFGGQTISNAGIYYDTLQTIHGCDSIFKLYLKKPIFSGGIGTEAVPYLISSKEDLAELSDAVINENNWCLNKHFLLINSIYDTVTSIVGSEASPFKGYFHGGGHHITIGLSYPNRDNTGLFGITSTEATIDSLTLAGYVTGNNNVGGVSGTNQGVILRCSNLAQIVGKDYVGGISGVGGMYGGLLGSGNISYCSNSGSINGRFSIGGISGSGNIIHCSNIGDINGANVWVGGITGFGGSNYCINAGTVSGINQTGGITGYGNTNKCLNIGEVICPHSYFGITGYGTSSYCYYDKQICTKNIHDLIDQTMGELTTEMLGTSLYAVLDSNFIYQNDLYPIPKGLENDSITILAATPVILNPLDTRESVAHPFKVRASNVVSWSSTSNKVTFFQNDSVQQNILGADTLIASSQNSSRRIPIKIIYVPTEGNLYISDCEAVIYNSITYSRDSVFNAILQNQYGDDSLISIIVDIKSVFIQIRDSIVLGGTYDFNGQILTRKGIYYDTLQTISGCDSIIQLSLLGVPFSGGSGLANNPYSITCREDMEELSTNVLNYGDGWTTGKYFRLMNDITDTVSCIINNFSGFFEGAGHSIMVAIKKNANYVGLFASNGSVIDSLSIKGTVKGWGSWPRVGGLVGYNSGTISNCVNYAEVHGRHSGGICGLVNGGLEIKCENYGKITGWDNAGGIAGETVSASILYCQNSGSVNAINAGGICASSSLSDGVVGYCVNTGKVIGENIGGIIGSNSSNSIVSCYNAGSIIQTCNHTNHGAGGICGNNSKTLSNCINAGTIFSNNNNDNTGVFCGLENEGHKISNSYFDRQLTGAVNNNQVDVKITPQMIGYQLKLKSSPMDCGAISNEQSLIYCGWTYSEKAYPRPSLADRAFSPISLVAASPVFFDTVNLASSVSLPFSVSFDNNVNWSSQNNKVRIDRNTGNVQIVETGSDTLIANLDNATKLIPITITNLPDTVILLKYEDCNEVVYKNVSYTQSTQFNEKYKNCTGGDSIINVIIKINKYLFESEAVIYEGYTCNFRGQILSESGIYYDSLFAVNSCDSVYKFTLSVLSNEGIIYVDPNGQGNGTSWTTPTSNLQGAISIAAQFVPKRKVWVKAGTFYGDDDPDNNAFLINWGVNVFGGFSGNETPDYNLGLRDFSTNQTILDGKTIHRVVKFDYHWSYPYWSGTQYTKLDGFTIQNGRVSGSGGGVLFENQSQILTNCIIQNNSSENKGGGLSGNGTIINCIISGNSAHIGGGLYSCRAINSVIARNSADLDGGVSQGELVNCIVWGNNNGQLSGGSAIYSAIQEGFSGQGNINLAPENTGSVPGTYYPQFIDPDFNLFKLKGNSACVNTGNTDTTGLNIPLTDIQGKTRIQNEIIDIGAFEYGCDLTRIIIDTAYLPYGSSYPYYGSSITKSGTYLHSWKVDDSCDSLIILKLLVIPTCPKPSNLSVVDITTTSVQIQWSETSEASEWNIEFGLSGFANGSGTSLNTTSHSYTLTGLLPNTQYSIYVRSDCGEGDSSEPVFTTFSTLPTCPAPINIAVSAVSSTAKISWSETGTATAWNIEYGFTGFIRGNGITLHPTTDTITLTGLLSHATYDIYIQSNCGVGDVSGWTFSKFYTNTYIYVTTNGSGSMDGSSWENSIPYLQAAIYSAQNSGSIVWVAAGTYSGDIFTNYAFSVPAGVTIYGGFAGNEEVGYNLSSRNFKTNSSILDGQNIQSVVQAGGILNGFTIQNGFSENGAGGFDSGISSISGGLGGKLINCVLRDNTGFQGGGASGGELINCIIRNNTASLMSGGAASSRLINCTVVDNIAGSYAGGVYGGTLINCIVSRNNFQQVHNSTVSFSAIQNGYEGETNINLDSENNGTNPENYYARFVNPDDGPDADWRLAEGSACINKGKLNVSELNIPSSDFSGNPRIQNGRIDIGAYEYFASTNSIFDTICVNENYTFFGQSITTSGTYSHHLQSFSGGDSIVVLNLIVNSLPFAASYISGLSNVYYGQDSVVYSIPLIPDATSYLWELPSGAIGTSTTNSITIAFTDSAVSGNISVKGYNECGYGSSSTLNVTLFKQGAFKVFLEGLYNPESHLMNGAKDENGTHFNSGIADKISIELHNSSFPYSMVYVAYDIYLKTDGTTECAIPSEFQDSYYIVIKHRNSLETWSNVPVSFQGISINYDFSDSMLKAFEGNMKKLEPGFYGLYSGDINHDGLINALDLNNAQNGADNFHTGYIDADNNGDGVIDALDLIIIDNNASNFIEVKKPQ